MRKVDYHASRMRDFVKKPSAGTPQLGSAVVDAIDEILAGQTRRGPLETEVLEPLVEIAAQVALLREGRLGPLTLEQRQALNVAHGRLGQVVAMLRRLTDETAATSQIAYEASVAN
jgi:hypothetical protein